MYVLYNYNLIQVGSKSMARQFPDLRQLGLGPVQLSDYRSGTAYNPHIHEQQLICEKGKLKLALELPSPGSLDAIIYILHGSHVNYGRCKFCYLYAYSLTLRDKFI